MMCVVYKLKEKVQREMNTILNFRIKITTKKRLHKRAIDLGMTMTQLVSLLIKEHLDAADRAEKEEQKGAEQ